MHSSPPPVPQLTGTGAGPMHDGPECPTSVIRPSPRRGRMILRHRDLVDEALDLPSQVLPGLAYDDPHMTTTSNDLTKFLRGLS
jgi:hypothetical protein